MSTVILIGWAILISSWTVPLFLKDREKKNLVGLILSAVASGYFIGIAIQTWLK